MRSEYDEINHMLGTDINYGCGQAVYDGSDGPRERGEEELMSPPMQPNGGGGGYPSPSEDCPFAGYEDYGACLNHYEIYDPPQGYYPHDYCVHVCYETPGPAGMSDCMGYCSLGGCSFLCGILWFTVVCPWICGAGCEELCDYLT